MARQVTNERNELVFCNCAAPLLQNYDADQQRNQPAQYLPDTIANEFTEVD
jgi:hypothetical protein